MDMATKVHRSVIEMLIAQAAGQCATFADLLASLPGVGPDDAAFALDYLAARHLIDPAAADRLNPRAQTRRDSGVLAAEDDGLPCPHPLDYDWRFTPDAAEWMRTQCVQASDPGDMIALLGTPTVLKAATARPEGRRWALLEANPAVSAALTRAAPRAVLRCDLARDNPPRLQARVVAADPPWYPAHTRVFLWAAAQVSMLGAVVLLAQPGAGTRPGILAERAELLAYAAKCGLRPVRISPGTLEYACPPFERLVLERNGLAGAVPQTWRRGDLIELRHMTVRQQEKPELAGEQTWREVVLYCARLRFRLDRVAEKTRPADPRLIPLVDGDILTSVSRRDPARRRAAVWTASNRVFGCRTPGLLAVIASALANGEPTIPAAATWLGSPPSPAEISRIEHAANQLIRLARVELAGGPAASKPAGSISGQPPPDPAIAGSQP
ncbi:MAG TPA: hypothetical protein VFQ44_17405 [Streptosporangiaceae bacterium]|nr:hypothetical protein [Streptosporangiaceae bacterium]